MNPHTPRRLAEILTLFTLLGRRRIGGLIALVLILLWTWAAFNGPDTGDRFKYRGKFGGLTTTTYSYSHPR